MKNLSIGKVCFFLVFRLIILGDIMLAGEKYTKTKSANHSNKTFSVLSGCAKPTSHEYLDINNVRAILLNGGDMWWDGKEKPYYEIPKGSGINSIFSGAIWIGGLDAGNNLKIAAQTYRQNSYDFWAGPLSDASVIDMTFYYMKIINRSATALFKTYLGQWVDADLGNYLDDYIECDVRRGIGFYFPG